MTACPFEFALLRPGADGVEVVDRTVERPGGKARPAPEPVLLFRRQGAGRPSSGGVYEPFRESGLFRTFADVGPTAEGCLAFARRYGGLGSSAEYLVAPSVWGEVGAAVSARGRKRLVETGVDRACEPLRVWRAGVAWFRYAVDLWDAAQAGDGAALSSLLEVSDEAGASRVRPVGADFVDEDLPRPFTRWQHPSALGPRARLVLDDGLSLGRTDPGRPVPRADLASAAFGLCMYLVNDALEGCVEYRLRWDRQLRRPVGVAEPQDLWGAMLLQFSFAIGGDKKYQKCPVCGRWFELAPGVNRANRVTCSASCRTRGSRLRQEEAMRLYAEGKSPREIVEATGARAESVRAWIRQAKGR